MLWRRRRASCSEFFGIFALLGATAVRGPAAAKNKEKDEATDARREANDEGQVAVDPGFDFFADRAVLALAVLAGTSASTRGTVQEILLQAVACSSAEFRTRATELAVAVVAGIGIVALRVAAHDSLALLVSRRTLSTGAAESVATAFTVWLSLILRTVRAGSIARLLRVAGTDTWSTYGTR